MMVMMSAGSAFAEQGTVIGSSSPAYPVGTSLADGMELSLEDGMNISILTISARMVELSGPYAGPVPAQGNSADNDLLDNLGDAVFQTDEGSPELGGVRPLVIMAPEPLVPDAVVDVDHGGAACVTEGSGFGLHRGIPEGDGGDWTYGDLSSDRTGQTAQVRWDSLEYNVGWPVDMAVEDGDSFTLQMAGADAPVNFSVHTLPQTDSVAERINWMAERGCVNQIQGLVTEMQAS